MIKQIAKQFIKNSKQFIKNIINLNVFTFTVCAALSIIVMYFCFHYSMYHIFIGDMIALLICFLLILIHTIWQVVLKSKKNN